jgi:hypothetical protein
VVLAACAATICLVWGVPASAQASSAPVIESQSVSNLAPTDATLEAKINTEGLETTYEFYLQEPSICRQVNPPCMMPESEPVALPSGGLLGSFVPQSVSAGLNSAGVTDACLSEAYYWVTATNSAGTTIGQRHQMPAVETLVAVKCTPLRFLQLNTTGSAQNAGHGTTTANGSNTTPSPKQRVRANAKKLSKALNACKRKPGKRRASCVKQAQKQYGPTTSKARKR